MNLLSEGSTGITTAFDTAIKAIQSDTNGMITTALPVALAIAGTFIAIRLGIKFFKQNTK